MRRLVNLVALDFGTTTSNALIGSAELAFNSLSHRTELTAFTETYRSETVFTPLRDEGLDLERLDSYLDAWLAGDYLQHDRIFGGGALLTGLTAQKTNASDLIQLIRRHLGETLIAVADDSSFESWLAFMGSSARLSRDYPDRMILNMDIGGGTTNLAVGRNGEVLWTGSLFVGARHIQVDPGTYRIQTLSRYARHLLEHLAIRKDNGDCLSAEEVERILDFYLELLVAAITGDQKVLEGPIFRLHQQSIFRPLAPDANVTFTLSGGVGKLVYSYLMGASWPATTCFGDLGIDLARRIIDEPRWREDLPMYIPQNGGRATAFGLLRYSTQASGNTLFLPHPEVLPLRNIPVMGSISPASTNESLCNLLELVQRSSSGGCLQVKIEDGQDSKVPELGNRIAEILEQGCFPVHRPLVFLLDRNFGKVLGNCVTRWGNAIRNVLVIDEITFREAQFIHIGPMQEQVVPVAFYGMNIAKDAL